MKDLSQSITRYVRCRKNDESLLAIFPPNICRCTLYAVFSVLSVVRHRVFDRYAMDIGRRINK